MRNDALLIRAARANLKVHGRHGMPIAAEAATIWSLLQHHHNGKPLPTIRHRFNQMEIANDGSLHIYRGARAGTAYYNHHRIVLWNLASWHTLAHEMVHLAIGAGHGHNAKFYAVLREVIEARWSITLSVHDAPRRYGYAWDSHYMKQYEAHMEREWPAHNFFDTSILGLKRIARRKPAAAMPAARKRVSVDVVVMWCLSNQGERVTIADVCRETGAAHNTVRRMVHGIDGVRHLVSLGGGEYRVRATAMAVAA